MKNPKVASNVDRRAGADRRQFLYIVHIPERRSGMVRRDRFDGTDESLLDGTYESLLDRYDLERSKTYH